MYKFIIIIIVPFILFSCSNNNDKPYKINGKINGNTSSLADVTLTLKHSRYGTFTVKTDSNGNYTLPDLWDGEYTITPQKEGIIFEPKEAVVSINGDISCSFTGIITWDKIIPVPSGTYDSGANDVVISNDGYFIAGYIDTELNMFDFRAVKLDLFGETSWEKTYGTSFSDFAFSAVKQNSNTGYVIIGNSDTASSYKARVIKIDETGTIQKDGLIDQNYLFGVNDFDEVFKIIRSSDGVGYIIAGQTKIANNANVWVLKLNESLGQIGEIFFGDIKDDYANDICVTSTGYITVGGTKSKLASDKIINGYFLSTDSVLSIGSAMDLINPGGYEEEFNSIAPTTDGGYIVTGFTREIETSPYALVIIKKTSGLADEWRNVVHGTYGTASRGFSAIQTSDGGYAVAGESFNSSTRYDIVLIKFDSLGNMLWKRTYPGQYDDTAFSLKETPDSGFIIAGTTEGINSKDSIRVLKTDREGKIYGQSYDE